jgi:hypothetical protein
MSEGQPQDSASSTYNNASTTYQHQVGRSSSSVNDYLSRQSPDLGTVVPDLRNTTASKFPSRVGHGDPRDETMALKAQMLKESGDNGYLPGVGIAHATNADFQYFRDKELSEREADFKRFFLSNIDLSTPEKQDYYQRLYPEIFSERESLAEKQIEHQAHLMKINLRGPRNMEDWMFLYGLERGFIQVPKGPIWDPENLLRNTFEGGLFSIRKILPRDGYKIPTITGAFKSPQYSDGYEFNWKKPTDFTSGISFVDSSKTPFVGGNSGMAWSTFLNNKRA